MTYITSNHANCSGGRRPSRIVPAVVGLTLAATAAFGQSTVFSATNYVASTVLVGQVAVGTQVFIVPGVHGLLQRWPRGLAVCSGDAIDR